MQLIDLAAQQARLRPALDVAIAAVLDHGGYVMGPEVGRLEDELAGFVGAPVSVVSCASGTDALLMALLAHGVGPGDAVFVPAFTFPATAEVVALLGASPVVVDIEPDTFNMAPATLAEAVAHLPAGLRPVGVIPVDLYGLPADHVGVAAVARDHDMWVVADAAQSFGARRHGRRVGALAPVTTCSFFPAKPLGCYGDGGAVVVDDEARAAVLRSLRVHGAGRHKYEIERIGINGRLDTVQAAVLLVKLSVFAQEVDDRQVVAARYAERLADLPGVVLPCVPPGVTSAWAQYTVRVPGRDRVADALRSEGIPTAVYYPRPLHHQPPYTGFWRPPAGAPVAEAAAATVLSLPMHPYLAEADQDRVTDALARAVGAQR